ncbi:MAG: hypothetical protein ACUVWX_14015 [Kiritimatiellia bacterium]
MEIETTITMHEDGSATITERLNFSRQLLDMDASSSKLPALLSREAALARMKEMGEGVTLVSHTVSDARRGSKESVTVYKVPDIQNFVYPSPFLADRPSPGALKFTLRPWLKHEWATRWPAGAIIVDIHAVYPSKKAAAQASTTDLLQLTPEAIQAYRELAPVYRDMLEGFLLKVRFACYAPIEETRGIVHRQRRSAVKYVDLLSISDRDLDKYGYGIFENEEILCEILRWQIDTSDKSPTFGAFIADHLAGQGANLTLPVYHARSGGYVLIKPSLQLFQRYFEGKTLENRNGKFPARFEEIGYYPEKGHKRE